jgi:hypothetical protein
MPAIAAVSSVGIHTVESGDEADLVVERDDGELVVRPQPTHEVRGACLGRLELVTGHGARPVEHQRHVERRALLRSRRLGERQLQHRVHGVRRLHGDEGVIQPN